LTNHPRETRHVGAPAEVDRPDEPVRSKSSHRGGNRDATDEAFRGHKRCAPGEHWANDSVEAMHGSRESSPSSETGGGSLARRSRRPACASSLCRRCSSTQYGPRDHVCCIDLPARDGRAGSRDRGCVAVPDRTRTQRDGPIEGPKARSRRIIFVAPKKEGDDWGFPVERVTRIELAWPAWKVAGHSAYLRDFRGRSVRGIHRE
jgi:hypothetical protein